MKNSYLLIVHGENGDGAMVSVHATTEERDRATTKVIMGDENAECPELVTLREDGIVTFEGDPSVEWITGTVEPDITAAQALLEETYTWLHDGPIENDMRCVLHRKIGDHLGKKRVEYHE